MGGEKQPQKCITPLWWHTKPSACLCIVMSSNLSGVLCLTASHAYLVLCTWLSCHKTLVKINADSCCSWFNFQAYCWWKCLKPQDVLHSTFNFGMPRIKGPFLDCTVLTVHVWDDWTLLNVSDGMMFCFKLLTEKLAVGQFYFQPVWQSQHTSLNFRLTGLNVYLAHIQLHIWVLI